MTEPTMPAVEYVASEDPNLFRRLSSGDHENLLDELIEAIQDHERKVRGRGLQPRAVDLDLWRHVNPKM